MTNHLGGTQHSSQHLGPLGAERRATRLLWLLAFLCLPLIPGALAAISGHSPFGIFWTTVWTAVAIALAALLLTTN